MLLSGVLCHTKVLDDRWEGVRAAEKELPCRVIWWKRACVESRFVLQPLIDLDPFLNALDEESNYQCLLEFTSSQTHLVIALCLQTRDYQSGIDFL